jgi:hypothetical protein
MPSSSSISPAVIGIFITAGLFLVGCVGYYYYKKQKYAKRAAERRARRAHGGSRHDGRQRRKHRRREPDYEQGYLSDDFDAVEVDEDGVPLASYGAAPGLARPPQARTKGGRHHAPRSHYSGHGSQDEKRGGYEP